MFIEVLVSCMHQNDSTIISDAKLDNVRTLVINQCNVIHEELVQVDKLHRILNTNTRGLSVSRNLGIKNSLGDICVISDDDETFISNLNDTIISAYEKYPNADIIAFSINNHVCSLRNLPQKLNRLTLLKVSSCQITFKRKSIIDKKIFFDTKIGSGTGNGAGEENKFLLECHRAGLNIYFYPVIIATLNDSESRWFHGYDGKYFYNHGKTIRYIMGSMMGFLYCIYYLLSKHKMYCKYISLFCASKNMLHGFVDNDLNKNNK